MAHFQYIALKNRLTPRDVNLKRVPKGFPCYAICLIGRDFEGRPDPGAEVFLTDCNFKTLSIQFTNRPRLEALVLGSWSNTWETYEKLKRDFDKSRYPFLHWLKVARILDLETYKDFKDLEAWKMDPVSQTLKEWRPILNLTALEREIDLPEGTLRHFEKEGVPAKWRDKVVRYLQYFGADLKRLETRKKNYLTEKTELKSSRS